jgi:hypothetical protein
MTSATGGVSLDTMAAPMAMAYLVAAHQYHLGARALLQQGRQAAHEHVVAAIRF